MSSAMFVDESKARGYTIAAVVVPEVRVAAARRELEALRMKGQKRFHFVRESDSRRRLMLSTLARLDVQAYLYRAEGLDAHAARDLCLRALVRDAAGTGVRRIVLEADETVMSHDRVTLHAATFQAGVDVRYGHERASAEPMLWAADAIAWGYTRGGDWVRRIAPMIVAARLLLP